MGTPSHLGHMDRVAATMPSQAHAGAAQEAPDIGQWEGQDVPLVRPSSCNVKGGIPSSRRYLPTYLKTENASGKGGGKGNANRDNGQGNSQGNGKGQGGRGKDGQGGGDRKLGEDKNANPSKGNPNLTPGGTLSPLVGNPTWDLRPVSDARPNRTRDQAC